MRFLAAVSVLVGASLVVAGTDDTAQKKELKALQGTWKLVSVEVAGEAIPKINVPAITFTLRPDGVANVQVPGVPEFQTRTTVDPGKNPRALETVFLGGKFKGQKRYGIYKLEGDRFTVCQTPVGIDARPEDRPAAFTTKGTKAELVVWERVKDEKKRP